MKSRIDTIHLQIALFSTALAVTAGLVIASQCGAPRSLGACADDVQPDCKAVASAWPVGMKCGTGATVEKTADHDNMDCGNPSKATCDTNVITGLCSTVQRYECNTRTCTVGAGAQGCSITIPTSYCSMDPVGTEFNEGDYTDAATAPPSGL